MITVLNIFEKADCYSAKQAHFWEGGVGGIGNLGILVEEISGICFLYYAYRKTRCHAIAKTTARCAQYMSAKKNVCKHKSSRRLRKNLHITILSLFGGESIFEVFQQM